MSYATQAEMVERFGAAEMLQLLDRDRDDAADAGVFEGVEADASALIDGYLRAAPAGYPLPLPTTPVLLRQLAGDITRYLLWSDKAPKEVRTRYEDAIKRLEAIARGLLLLDLVATVAATGEVGYTERCRTFDDCTLRGFMG